ncbi:universal stress protein [Humisphaera borealis]|uniref:Amino acid permease n=1 Tax=Humisphaera borealis TaxID=2807512 RepID=A0A7M2WQU5_9BACT|nr:universal stress protein [Humisphaera borealis]QOV87925.1 amino acid permease [Humisphaera borealis]
MQPSENSKSVPQALSLLSSERPRNVSWFGAGALLFGDWGTSRLYVLGLAFLVAGRSSFWLIAAMSLLIVAVGWAYTQICRIYADGGGVYTAGRQRSAVVGVIGALLLFADYTVTASLSAVEGFHYFGFGSSHTSVEATDPGDTVIRQSDGESSGESTPLIGPGESTWAKIHNSPGLLAIGAILLIGALNLLGPKHSAGFALFAAVGMMVITLLIVVFALPQIDFANLDWGRLWQPPGDMWYGFVYIVLALSGVEAIANLTGVMKKPVYATARKSIWLVTIEVAIFNLLLAIVMISLASKMGRESHKEDMLAFMANQYVGPIGEWPVRILGGLLLLSATNTAIGALTGTIYVMSRDGELPRIFQRLNSFGAPWVATVLATSVPAFVLMFVHDLTTLASMYAIGVVGAVAINCSLTSFHPRLRKWYRKTGMVLLGALLVVIWLTLAFTKLHATAFVAIVLSIGLILRSVTKIARSRSPKPSLFRQAVIEQLTPEAMMRPKLLLATAGSDAMAEPALRLAKETGAALVVSFVREVSLNFKVESENRMTLDTDPAAQELFTEFLAHGHRYGVPIIPAYDTSQNAPEQIAELAAMFGAEKVLIGSSRRGAIHTFIKGSFQKKLESLLPPEMSVKVLQPVRTSADAGMEEETPAH